jgi:hypothetical protein
VTIDILALIIIILFATGVRNCPDAPAVSSKNEIPQPANIPPPNPQPNEQAVVDAPPQNQWPVYEGVAAILSAFDEETRNQIGYVSFINYDEGVNFKAEVLIGGRLCALIFESIQDVDTVFPKMKHLAFDGRAPENLVLNDFGHQKFRNLVNIRFYRYTNSGTFSLTLLGAFNSLKSLFFSNCEMGAIAFSGGDATAIEGFSIRCCNHLADVTGIWDGGNPPLGRNSFKELTIEKTPFLNVTNLNTWLKSHATKYDTVNFKKFTHFDCQNNEHEIKVYIDRRDLKPSDLNILTDMNITTKIDAPFAVDIPFRRNTQHPWNINVRSWAGFPTVALEFEGSGNVADEAVMFQQNAVAAGEINTENTSNFQMNITCKDPIGKIIFNAAPWEPVAIALTKKNPLFTVEFMNSDAVPGELFLKEIPCMEGAANAVPPRAPNAADEVIAHPAPEPHGLKVILGGNSEAVGLWRKGGVGHYLAVGKSRDVSGLKHAGWQEVRKEEITGFGAGILFRRENILPAPVP